jgi:hypothetical protein
MEGKVMLFKEFADIDGWPLCLATQDTDAIVRFVQAIAPTFGGINLEDISAHGGLRQCRWPRGWLSLPGDCRRESSKLTGLIGQLDAHGNTIVAIGFLIVHGDASLHRPTVFTLSIHGNVVGFIFQSLDRLHQPRREKVIDPEGGQLLRGTVLAEPGVQVREIDRFQQLILVKAAKDERFLFGFGVDVAL